MSNSKAQILEIREHIDFLGGIVFPDLDEIDQRCLLAHVFVPSIKEVVTRSSSAAIRARNSRTRTSVQLSKKDLQIHILKRIVLSIEQSTTSTERLDKYTHFPLSKLLNKR